MITLTDTDVVRLLRKNNLNSDTLQENVVAKLREKGVKLATAESCTGGLLSERITAVSGASDVFDFGVCTYANEMKHKVLGVSNETLSVLGAVSAETAMQMAEGARNVSGADLAVRSYGRNSRKACRSCLLRNQHKRQKLCNKAHAWRQY